QVSAKTPIFPDSGLNPGTQYFYRIRATNSAGTSGYSAEAAILMPTPPATPSNAHTTLVTATTIEMAWQDNATNEDGYRVFRRATGGDFVLIRTLPADSTSYQDTG